MSSTDNLSSSLAALAILLGTSSLARVPAHEKSSLPEQYREASDWFDELRFPKLDGKPFVKITLKTSGDTESELATRVAYGFVMNDIQDVRSILTTDLRLLSVATCSSHTGTVVIEETPLEPYARSALEDPDSVQRTTSESYWKWKTKFQFETQPTGTELQPFAIDFMLARVCLSNALDDFGRVFAERAVERKLQLVKSERLKDNLCFHFRIVFLNRAVVQLADPSTPRDEVLARLQWLLRNRFDYRHDRRREIENMVSSLRKMDGEDHLDRNRTAWRDKRKLTPGELVYCLRDQTGDVQGTHRFFYCIDVPRSPWQVTPAEQLVAMGDQAVPALIEAVEDTRLTRIVGLKNRHVLPEWRPSTVGNCAVTLLATILADWPEDWHEWPEDELCERLRHWWEGRQKAKSDETANRR
jgi:hypothetical protein